MLLLPLWPWLLLEERALTAALELLCVYTANCAAACSSLCGVSSSHSLGPAPVPRAGPSGSLMHCVMRLASPSCPDSGPIHALAFSLLASLAISRDCKGLLHKSNFLQHFLSVAVPRRGARAGWPEAERWLRLLLNVSFGEDGQRMILRLQGGLELLTELAGRGPRAGRPTALLALHNVCFCPANKPKVLASDPTVRLLVSCLDAEALDVRAIGASALWALLHNNQKAKATLKYPFVRLKVEGAYTSAKKASTDGEQRDQQTLNAYLIKCLGNLSQLLNT